MRSNDIWLMFDDRGLKYKSDENSLRHIDNTKKTDKTAHFIKSGPTTPLQAFREQFTKTPGATLVRSTADKEDLVAIVEGKSGALDSEIVELAQHGHAVELKGIVGIGSAPSLRHLSEPMARAVGGEDGWIAKGVFEPNHPVVVPGGLSGLDDALEKNKKGVSGEKFVIRPFE